MISKSYPELHAFFTTWLTDSDSEQDRVTARNFGNAAPESKRESVIREGRKLLDAGDLPLDELGSEANRWFGDQAEASSWLEGIIEVLEGLAGDAPGLVVKDCNGTPLAEGDSVTVIKDLKVKGGSSDLKRGTMVRKIHLIDDPEVVECRVDGSTLVLKTCFLRKA